VTSIHNHVSAASHRLRAAGIPQPEADLDARLLARELLGWDAAKYLTSSHEVPTPDFGARFAALVAKREAREPMAYILGRQEFWGRPFALQPDVLIPRPETELIIETALGLFPDRGIALRIADVGTGSGCLALTLGAEFPAASVTATDTSSAAIDVARRNAQALAVADRITFAQTDVLAGVEGTFDLIVSNPPYVPDIDRPTLQPEVAGYEPGDALFGGPDGLAVVRRVVSAAAASLAPSGWLLVEFGLGQSGPVTVLISATPGLTMVALKRDLQGIPRVVVARSGPAV
jgi:release factor glutamine methyltransferase